MNAPPHSATRGSCALSGFVTLADWCALENHLNAIIKEQPNEILFLECNRVTGFAINAFLALGRFIDAAPGRVRLQNWPGEVSRAITAHFQLTCALGSATAALASGRAEGRNAPVLEALAQAARQMSEVITKLGTPQPGGGAARPEAFVAGALRAFDPSTN